MWRNHGRTRPATAAYPEMPQSAINNMHVDYCVPIAELGPLLERRVHEQPGKTTTIPHDVRTEAPKHVGRPSQGRDQSQTARVGAGFCLRRAPPGATAGTVKPGARQGVSSNLRAG